MTRTILAAAAMAMALAATAEADPLARPRQPFVTTLSNNTPLAFGMDAEQTSRVLGQPLHYVRGAPGQEIYLALRDIGGSRLIPSRHRLFLQFRHGRLAAWKEDYGENWMWE